MSRVPSLSSPFLIGFDQIERALDRVAKAADGYPPYNIERLAADEKNPERLRITLAVAGFTLDQLEVTVEEKELVIRGRQQDDKSRQYLHRGIAARQFQRTFVLADGMEVLEGRPEERTVVDRPGAAGAGTRGQDDPDRGTRVNVRVRNSTDKTQKESRAMSERNMNERRTKPSHDDGAGLRDARRRQDRLRQADPLGGRAQALSAGAGVAAGHALFALHAADGTPIMVTDSREAAVANAITHELETVSVH